MPSTNAMTTSGWQKLVLKRAKSASEKALVAAVRILSTTIEWQSTPLHEIYARVMVSGERTTP